MKKFIIITILFCFALASCDYATNEDLNKLKNEVDSLKESIQNIPKELQKSFNERINPLYTSIQQIIDAQQKQDERFENLQDEIDRLNEEIAILRKEIRDVKSKTEKDGKERKPDYPKGRGGTDSPNPKPKPASLDDQKNEIINKTAVDWDELNNFAKNYFILEDYLDFLKFFHDEFKNNLLMYDGTNEGIKDYIDNARVLKYNKNNYTSLNDYTSILSRIQKHYKEIYELTILNNHNNNDVEYPEIWGASAEELETWSIAREINDSYGGRIYILRYNYIDEDETGEDYIIFSKINGAWKIIDFDERHTTSGK